jgi:hypothetical protein
MPIVYYDILRGRTRDQIRALLDSTQAALVEAWEVPERDRFQVVTEHSPDEMIILDRGLGIERSEKVGAAASRRCAARLGDRVGEQDAAVLGSAV